MIWVQFTEVDPDPHGSTYWETLESRIRLEDADPDPVVKNAEK